MEKIDFNHVIRNGNIITIIFGHYIESIDDDGTLKSNEEYLADNNGIIQEPYPNRYSVIDLRFVIDIFYCQNDFNSFWNNVKSNINCKLYLNRNKNEYVEYIDNESLFIFNTSSFYMKVDFLNPYHFANDMLRSCKDMSIIKL